VEDAASLDRPQAVSFTRNKPSPGGFSQPYRQRFLRIAPSANSLGVESAVFKPQLQKLDIGKPEAERRPAQ